MRDKKYKKKKKIVLRVCKSIGINPPHTPNTIWGSYLNNILMIFHVNYSAWIRISLLIPTLLEMMAAKYKL